MTPYKTGNLFQIILELSKVRITVAVALTTITGYILASRSYNTGFIFPTLGIFFLACGSSVINHLQERNTDAIMSRTRLRPLPANAISPFLSTVIAFVEVLAGSLILFYSAGLKSLSLGLLALIWYNVVYTNLKKVTPNAVIPGSVIGSIPPLVGWVAAGGELLNFQAMMLALFFFIWQVPHFYLLAIKYGHEYEEAGLPSLTTFYPLEKIKRNIFIWIVFTAFAAFIIALSPLSCSFISSISIMIFSLLLVYSFLPMLLEKRKQFDEGRYFMQINYFVVMVIIMLVAGPFLQSLYSR